MDVLTAFLTGFGAVVLFLASLCVALANWERGAHMTHTFSNLQRTRERLTEPMHECDTIQRLSEAYRIAREVEKP